MPTHPRGLAAAILCLLPCTAFAAGISGTVKDASGGAVVDAEVLVLTSLRSVAGTTRSGPDGRFDLPAIEPGNYLVLARRRGLQESQVAAVVTASDPATLTITLQLAGVAEEVTVTAAPGEIIERRDAAQSVNLISQDEIAFRATTVLGQAFNEETGVALQRTSPTMAGVFVRGLTGNKVNVFVDGVRYSNSAQRGGVNTFFDLLEPTGLEGIEVLRGPNSAEYGSDALGGSIQLLSNVPALSTTGRARASGQLGVRGSTGHETAAGNFSGAATWPSFGLFGNIAATSVGQLRPGGGIDSHASVTRFFGISSDLLYPERLPNTEFDQIGGMLKANWVPGANTRLVATYMRTRQDGGDRWDQLLGGDGNLIAELNDMQLDLFYVRAERLMTGLFDSASVTYSFNTQREERVNQGGNGNPSAAIGHEPERTTANGVQGNVFKQLSTGATLRIGGEIYLEGLTSDSFNVTPSTGAVSARRPRVPSGAIFRNYGVFAQAGVEALPDRLRIVGALRWGGAHYESHAADAPIVGGKPLWPDDSLTTSSPTFRVGAVATPGHVWSFSTSLSRGYRAPHMTDLGTLGLTGSGFEVSYPEVADRSAFVGSTAGADAVSTGEPVEQMRSESSLAWDAAVRFHQPRARGEFSVFINTVHDNIQKQALILPLGAVGTTLGTEVITAQNANGVVFVAASTAPVLVRDNFDNAKIWGIEGQGQVTLIEGLALDVIYTYLHARDTATDRPPNIEGGTPAPTGYLLLRYSPPGSRWWVQPYLRIVADQPNLSSLDLGDRRTGADRSRNSIRAFFLNGATARGWVAPGADGAMGTADDILSVTGETLAQIQNRVLGTANNAPLFPEVLGYTMAGVRGGLRFGPHEVLVDFENISDENFRGISWGMDNAGRGITVRYAVRF
jgi:outer membrane receptor protein involved in Fe transport